MKLTNALSIILALLFLMVGTAGCNSGSPFGLSSLRLPGMSSGKIQAARFASNTNQHHAAAKGSLDLQNHVASKQPADPAINQHAQVGYNQTLYQTSVSPAAAPLITLGPNDDFHQIVETAPGVVLVDFYADWCGPCRKQGKILHELEGAASKQHASIIKVNTEQHKDLARQYKVSSLPTLVLMRNGKIIERQTGLANRQKVEALLSR